LRALENGEIERIGEEGTTRVDARLVQLIAAWARW
jgi:transcriptional regulator with GAF, ATPase, and Fis domain